LLNCISLTLDHYPCFELLGKEANLVNFDRLIIDYLLSCLLSSASHYNQVLSLKLFNSFDNRSLGLFRQKWPF